LPIPFLIIISVSICKESLYLPFWYNFCSSYKILFGECWEHKFLFHKHNEIRKNMGTIIGDMQYISLVFVICWYNTGWLVWACQLFVKEVWMYWNSLFKVHRHAFFYEFYCNWKRAYEVNRSGKVYSQLEYTRLSECILCSFTSFSVGVHVL